MGKHSRPDQPDTLGLAKAYSDTGYRYQSPNRHDFHDWWEQYVNEPVQAANDLDAPTKIIPLIANMEPEPEPDLGEVDIWKVLAYIIMISLAGVILFYLVAAVLAVALLATLLSAAWLAKR